MDPDSIFNFPWDHDLAIEGTTNRPDVNAPEDEYQQQTHDQSEDQHNHFPTVEASGFSGHEPHVEGNYGSLSASLAFIEPKLEEKLWVLERFSTVHDGGFHRYMTPPTSPVLPARRPPGHNTLPPHPDLLSFTPEIPEDIWYGIGFFAETMSQDYQHRLREGMHPLERAFICNKLRLDTEVIITQFREEFILTPWPNEHLRRCIEETRWKAKVYIWKPEELESLCNSALQHKSELNAWLSLRAKWFYYPKDRLAVFRKYKQIQQEVAQDMPEGAPLDNEN